MIAPYKAVIPHSTHLAIRHSPVVVAHCTAIARKGAAIGGANWTVVVQNDPSTKRPRAYIAPKNEEAEADDATNSTVFKIISGLRGE